MGDLGLTPHTDEPEREKPHPIPHKSEREAKPEIPTQSKQALSNKWQVADWIQNRYEIFDILGGPGKSGMGIVYICYDHKFKEAVAIKTFQDKFLKDRASIERFKWEAEAWIKLEKHHNIVQAKFVDEIEGRPYIFMEYIVGHEQYGVDLSGWIKGDGLTLPQTLNFAIQICHGMIHAANKFREMEKPFVHRDIKPPNIMITRDKAVKITDFGLVKAFAELDDNISSRTFGDELRQRLDLSKSGNICGTPPYMSPEQCRGEKDIDVRSDIYSFGCVLYEMVTKKNVFDARTAEELISHHLNIVPKSPNVQKELDRMVMKCLEKDPDKRYQDFYELEKALSELYHRLTGDVVKQPNAIQSEASEINNKGVSLANLGLLEEAIGCYLQVLHLDPNYAYAHYNLGVAYNGKGNLDAAIAEYKEALRIDPNNADTHRNLGLVYIDKGNLDAAIAEFKEALSIDPNYGEAHDNLGNAYYRKGNLDAAIAEFKEALRINPNYGKAHDNLGVAYNGKGNLDAAIAEYKEALRINPNDAEAHNNLGVAYNGKGNPDAAIAEYKEALRIDPNNADTHKNLGLVYNDKGNLDAAIAEFKEALRINPNYGEVHNNLGNAYCGKGNLDAAIAEFKEFLRINPNEAGGHNNLGVAYRDQGKFDAAIAEFKEALRLKPDYPATLISLGDTYKDQCKFNEAIRQYKEFIRLASPEYASLIKQAEEYIRQLEQKL